MSAYHNQSILSKVRDLQSHHPYFLDTETTGLGPDAEIVEIAILDFWGDTIVDTLVQPQRPIPADAVRIHGIRNEMVNNAPRWSEVWPQVKSVIEKCPVGIYNADFDVRMLQQTSRIHGLVWEPLKMNFFCIMKMYASVSGYGRYQSLDSAGRQIGTRLTNVHRARADTLLAREVFLYLSKIAGEK